MHISPYEQGNIFNHDPLRARKLLMHKIEIVKLSSKNQKKKGFTLVPLKSFILAKVEQKVALGLATGKKNL